MLSFKTVSSPMVKLLESASFYVNHLAMPWGCRSMSQERSLMTC